MSRLLESLEAATAQYPIQRKMLVVPDLNYGREILTTLATALARRHGGWIGWVPVTLRGLADALTLTTRHQHGLRLAGDVELRLLIDEAFESCLADGRAERLNGLRHSLGFRTRLQDTILELRMAGVSSDRLHNVAIPDSLSICTAHVLNAYEAILTGQNVADPAIVFAMANEVFDAESRYMLDQHVFIAPMMQPNGLSATLLDQIRNRGAVSLDTDNTDDTAPTFSPVPHAEQVTLFAAATPADEIREALRRVSASGARWDNVELVATDPDTYGIALDAICEQSGVGATMLCGLPLQRSYVGQTVLEWIEDFHSHADSTTLAAFATTLLNQLASLPLHTPSDEHTAGRVQVRLQQLADQQHNGCHRNRPASEAVAIVHDVLSDVRSWPVHSGLVKPWSAAGGKLYLTDIRHAGLSGRPYVFVMGLDAGRLSGAFHNNALLPDTIRPALGGLLTAAERETRKNAQISHALASLRGVVTLSYAVSGALDGHDTGPSTIMLRAFRTTTEDSNASYDDLRKAITPPACAVPAPESAPFDVRDVWLGVIASEPVLHNARHLIESAFPLLGAGLRAAAQRAIATPTAYHGILGPTAKPLLDPTTAISPSSLELLATCPLAWFYQHGVGLTPPDDVERGDTTWLSAMERGQLLHQLYERIIQRFMRMQDAIASSDADSIAQEILNELVAEWRVRVVPPSDSVLAAEVHDLTDAVRMFLAMERQDREEYNQDNIRRAWRHAEYFFGGERAATYTLETGRAIQVVGRIDRIDDVDDTICVIDYKTGKSSFHTSTSTGGPFQGGRRLQPAIYAHVAEQIFGKQVAYFEYRFPTRAGSNDIVRYSANDLLLAQPIIERLLTFSTKGAYLPTTDTLDCKHCNYRAICRVRDDKSGKGAPDSPRAAWAKTYAKDIPEYATMRLNRGESS